MLEIGGDGSGMTTWFYRGVGRLTMFDHDGGGGSKFPKIWLGGKWMPLPLIGMYKIHGPRLHVVSSEMYDFTVRSLDEIDTTRLQFHAAVNCLNLVPKRKVRPWFSWDAQWLEPCWQQTSHWGGGSKSQTTAVVAGGGHRSIMKISMIICNFKL